MNTKMFICDHSRICNNETCVHKNQHTTIRYDSCDTGYCNRYNNETVNCIEVINVP